MLCHTATAAPIIVSTSEFGQYTHHLSQRASSN